MIGCWYTFVPFLSFFNYQGFEIQNDISKNAVISVYMYVILKHRIFMANKCFSNAFHSVYWSVSGIEKGNKDSGLQKGYLLLRALLLLGSNDK